MNRRMIRTLLVVGAVSAVTAFAYVQGYSDHVEGRDMALAPLALAQTGAQERPAITPTIIDRARA